jgi:hypothetical protein
MDKRTIGIIATVASVLLCACPGLFLCVFGGVTVAGIMPYSTDINGVVDTGMMSPGYGIAMLCVAVVLIIIPVVIGFLTLRKKNGAEVVDADISIPEEDM